jgi:serine protease Do
MRRSMAAGIGATILAAAWLAVGVGAVQAGDDQNEKPKARPKARVETLRMAGGSHLGVVLEDVGKDDLGRLKLSEEKGALVKEVRDDSPAQKAGLEPGDVILEYQGQAVWSAAQLSRFVRETPPGRTVSLEVSRDGSNRTLRATLAEGRSARPFDRLGDLGLDLPELPMTPEAPQAPRPPRAPRAPQLRDLRDFGFDGKDGEAHARLFRDFFPDAQPAKLGIQYEELSDQLAGYFKVDAGVLVSSVEDSGPAAKAGVKAGDVIVKVDGKAVRDGSDLRSAISDLDPGKETTLSVQRDGRPLDLKVTVGGRARRAPRGPTT